MPSTFTKPTRAPTTQALLICVNSYPATGGNSETMTLRPMSILVKYVKCKGNYGKCACQPIGHSK